MSRRKKNAGKGFGMMFHGAFGSKVDAKRKERQVHGFIRPHRIKGETRYIVMSERKNPIKRHKKNPRGIGKNEKPYVKQYGAYDFYPKYRGPQKWALFVKNLDTNKSIRRGTTFSQEQSDAWITSRNNPHELLVMGANPVNPVNPAREFVVPAGSTITIRTNPHQGGAENPLFSFHPALVPRHLRERTLERRKRVSWNRLSRAKRRKVAIAAGVSESLADSWAKIRWDQIPEGWKNALVSHLGAARNPSAAGLREDFTGAPSKFFTVSDEPHMPAGDYAELGKLLALYVKPAKGSQVQQITFRKSHPVVVSDESARQIWFVGGDQDISGSLDNFGARDHGDGLFEIGEARRIDYKQRKQHVPDPEVDEWRHDFGEQTGVRPILLFDPTKKRLLLEGGEYRIKTEGIVN